MPVISDIGTFQRVQRKIFCRIIVFRFIIFVYHVSSARRHKTGKSRIQILHLHGYGRCLLNPFKLIHYHHIISCYTVCVPDDNLAKSYTYIHTYMGAHIHTYIHTYITYIHTYIHTHTHIYIYIHTHIHTYIHTYIHIYIHTYIYDCARLKEERDKLREAVNKTEDWPTSKGNLLKRHYKEFLKFIKSISFEELNAEGNQLQQ